MKTKKYYLVLAVVTGILCVPAWGQVELPRLDLIGQANPTLAGIEELYVVIVPPDAEPNKDGLVWEKLSEKVKHKLKEGGVKARALTPFPRPYLRVYIDMLKLLDSQKYVFHIQTSLARTVILPMQRNLHIEVDVWKTESKMQAVSVKNMPTAVTSIVLQQVEAFIGAYLDTNPQDVQPTDTNDIVAIPPKQVKPAVISAVAEYKYVASKNSKVFHKPDCSSAKRISSKNLIGYNSRDEATKVDRRPCKRCKP